MTKSHNLFLLLLALAVCSSLQTSATANFLQIQDYDEQYRQQYHFSPPANWMNDPNGLIYFAGEYHMFYQYFPYGVNPDARKTWGHAVSTDLVHWENLDIAIPLYNDVSIWSGSAVMDIKNTSGLCTNAEGCMIAIYTAQTSNKQAQAIAYSNDRGRTFTEYPGNPVIDENSNSFRDPSVFWHDATKKWVMTSVFAGDHQTRFYSSDNLINWTHVGTFGPEGDVSGDWECPDLFPLSLDDGSDQRWVLSHSISGTVQYFIGEFDGTTFKNSYASDLILKVDYGRDFYAAITWNDQPLNRRLMMAWSVDPRYAGGLPTPTWRCSMSLIHELTLHNYPEGIRLKHNPPVELQQLRSLPIHADNIVVASNTTSLPIQGSQVELIVVFKLPTDQTTEFGVKVFVGDGQETLVGYDVKSQSLFVDRAKSGDVSISGDFGTRISQSMPTEDNLIVLQIFVDRGSVEVFGNNGRVTITELVFPDATKNAVELYSVGGTVTATTVDGWQIARIWPDSSETSVFGF